LAKTDPYDELVRRLYDAAAEPALWGWLLADLALDLGAVGASLRTWNPLDNSVGFSAYFGFGPDVEKLYRSYYGAIDPRRQALDAYPTGVISLCHDLFDENYARKSEFYNDFLLPQGGRYMMATRLTASEEETVTLSLHRNARQGHFEGEEAGRFRRLMPHATRAAQISRRFARLRAEGERLEAALHQVDQGVIVTDVLGNIVLANACAEQHLRAADGLKVVGGRLCASRSEKTAKLQAVIHQTGEGIGGVLSLERLRGQPPLSILAAPLTDRTGAAFGFQRPMVILFVTDPQRNSGTPTGVLRRLYGLTAAQAEVAVGVADGWSVEDIAKARRKSPNTVKVQLRAVLAKMGVSRRTDLVRLIVGLAQPR
jgi:DNA-binding CsgD family transcriptional regulator